MVDRAVGSAGTLRITDDGSTVFYYVLCSDSSTNVGTYRYAINGTNYTTTLPAGFGSRLLGTRAYSSSGTASLSQQDTGTQGLGGAASMSVSINRPAPNAPTDLIITRLSDTQHRLNWSRPSTYTSVVVQRRYGTGPAWSQWQQIGVASGNAFTLTDSTTYVDRAFQYRVAGRAASGQSAWSAVATVYTTPAAPSGVSAARADADIVVSASTLPPYATSFDVEDSGSVIASSVSLPFTHLAPNPAVAHTYRLRGKRGSLVGPWSNVSNTVQLVSPPNAPGGLTPNGGVRASDEDVTFQWVHNPVDSSGQSAYELRYRAPAGAWTTVAGVTTSSREVSLAVGSVEWQVRTKGAHPNWSPWSSTAVFSVIDRPGVAVTQPEDEWDASVLPVEWSWLQEQGRPQSSWRVELVSEGTAVETRSGSGATDRVVLNRRLTEGEWTVRVQAATGDVWSGWAEQTFDVVFDPPAVPSILAEWDEQQGVVNLTVAPGEGEPETVSLVIERSTDGELWELVTEVAEMAVLSDAESLSYGDTTYRVTAFTAEGAAASAEVSVEARSGAVWLSGGVGFSVACRLPFDPVVSVTAGRQRVTKQYAGRSLPVAYAGEALARVVAVSGTVADRDGESASVEDLTVLAQLEHDRFLFRDPDGRRVYGTIGEIQMPRQGGTVDDQGWNAYWGYSFTLTETETR